MAWVAIGSAVIGGVTSYMGGKAEAKANEEAGERSYLASMEANRFQDEAMGNIKELQEPWRVAGENALQAIIDMPDFEFTAETFQQMADPSYEWRVNQGVEALDRSGASSGRVLSGAQDKALMTYGQDMASQEYSNAFNRAKTTHDTNLSKQQNLAGAGQNAPNLLSQAHQNDATLKSQNLLGGTQAVNMGEINSAEAQSDAMSGIATSVNTGVENYLLQQKD